MAYKRIYDERMSFWVGNIHRKLLERAAETLEINQSVLARRLFYFLNRPKEDIRKMFGSEVDGYEYPPKFR